VEVGINGCPTGPSFLSKRNAITISATIKITITIQTQAGIRVFFSASFVVIVFLLKVNSCYFLQPPAFQSFKRLNQGMAGRLYWPSSL
jgi:hypothetical protein